MIVAGTFGILLRMAPLLRSGTPGPARKRLCRHAFGHLLRRAISILVAVGAYAVMNGHAPAADIVIAVVTLILLASWVLGGAVSDVVSAVSARQANR